MQSHDMRGFALIAALIAVLLLMCVGVMALMLSTEDYTMGARIVAEKKVFSSVQEGIHDLAYHFDPSAPTAIPRTPAIDPDCSYSATRPVLSDQPYYTGVGNAPDKAFVLYESDVRGEYGNSASRIEVAVQLGYGPVQITTNYGNP